jgi:protoporphyrinogen oxidase
MKLGIIGAGISGLSLGQLCRGSMDVELLESSSSYGGIAKIRTINETPYHLTGGHCFNSKNDKVLDFVFDEVLAKDQWNHVRRNADIFFKKKSIPYPIEFSIKEIHQFDADLAFRIVRDFFSANRSKSSNLGEWFKSQFGETLANEYFIPYNEKIWGMDPFSMSAQWVHDKLPVTDPKNFLEGLIADGEDTMPHRHFFYPKSGNMTTFHDALAKNLKIRLNSPVGKIEKRGAMWVINEQLEYDHLVFTGSLKKLPSLLKDCSEEIVTAAKSLKVNPVSNAFWSTKGRETTWTYFPEEDSLFHRNIHIGNFINPQTNHSISEVVGNVSPETLKEEGRKVPYLNEMLDHHYAENAYVVFDEHYQSVVPKMKQYFEKNDLHLLGRFGEWEYYNMDVCIEKAFELKDKILRVC